MPLPTYLAVSGATPTSVTINFTDNAAGNPGSVPLPNDVRVQERWLIGGGSFVDPVYGAVTNTLADGAWHRYKRTFTIQALDVAGGTFNKMVLKFENFVGSGVCNPASGEPNRPSADFDDVRLWKLGAGDITKTGREWITRRGGTPA